MEYSGTGRNKQGFRAGEDRRGIWCCRSHYFTARNKQVNCVRLMVWEIKIKRAVWFLWFAGVVFVGGCGNERIGTATLVIPEYRQTDIFIPADACSAQTALPQTKREQVEAISAQPAAASGTHIDSRADLSGITADTPFGLAIEIMRNSTSPPLNIAVLWNDLRDNAGIDTQLPVGVDIVRGISLRKNLEIILTSLSTRQTKIDYTVIDGVIVIGTKESLPRQRQLRTYDITDLSSRPADYYSAPADSGKRGN
jgi:hypothetical protein